MTQPANLFSLTERKFVFISFSGLMKKKTLTVYFSWMKTRRVELGKMVFGKLDNIIDGSGVKSNSSQKRKPESNLSPKKNAKFPQLLRSFSCFVHLAKLEINKQEKYDKYTQLSGQ